MLAGNRLTAYKNPDAAPEDLAESFVADLQTRKGAVRDLVVLATEPAEIAVKPGFRVHLKYRAPAIHYFQKSLDQFEGVAKSVEVSAPPKGH